MHLRPNVSCKMSFLPAAFALVLGALSFSWQEARARNVDALAGFEAFSSGLPGRFDYYVFALSWNPAFCAFMSYQGRTAGQCRVRGLGFVVHGLWPQYRGGDFPENCEPGARSVDQSLLSSWPNDDLKFPPFSDDFIDYEWAKHGTCSGLGQAGYFGALRKAAARIRVPEAYLNGNLPLDLSEEGLKEEFLRSNPAFSANQLRVLRYRNGRISDLLFCVSKSLQPVACE